MKENDKMIIQLLTDALEKLPEDRKQYFMGFAEGVAAMAELSRNQSEDQAMSA